MLGRPSNKLLKNMSRVFPYSPTHVSLRPACCSCSPVVDKTVCLISLSSITVSGSINQPCIEAEVPLFSAVFGEIDLTLFFHHSASDQLLPSREEDRTRRRTLGVPCSWAARP